MLDTNTSINWSVRRREHGASRRSGSHVADAGPADRAAAELKAVDPGGAEHLRAALQQPRSLTPGKAAVCPVPIEGYDELTVEEISGRLSGLSVEDLRATRTAARSWSSSIAG